jgi:hypothetical protein
LSKEQVSVATLPRAPKEKRGYWKLEEETLHRTVGVELALEEVMELSFKKDFMMMMMVISEHSVSLILFC